MKKLSVRELHMIRDSFFPVALNLNIDFKDNQGLIAHQPFFLTINFHNQIKYSNSFLH